MDRKRVRRGSLRRYDADDDYPLDGQTDSSLETKSLTSQPSDVSKQSLKEPSPAPGCRSRRGSLRRYDSDNDYPLDGQTDLSVRRKSLTSHLSDVSIQSLKEPSPAPGRRSRRGSLRRHDADDNYPLDGQTDSYVRRKSLTSHSSDVSIQSLEQPSPAPGRRSRRGSLRRYDSDNDYPLDGQTDLSVRRKSLISLSKEISSAQGVAVDEAR